MPLRQIVIVGASAAGLTAAETLRDEGFDGRIMLVGDEPDANYDRPPLSKQFLLGDMAPADLALQSVDTTARLRLDARNGTAATGLDLARRTVALSTGEDLPYDGLLIATGLRPRRLPSQPEWQGIHMLRSLADAQRLRAALATAHRVLVVGGGFLGCELAATCRQRGLVVTLVDALPQPCQRQLGTVVGGAIHRLHAGHGVDLRCGLGITRLLRTDGADSVAGAVLSDGSEVLADLILLCIGSTPATEWLAGSGLDLRDGVVCDAFCQAADGVYAAGDVARWIHPGLQGSLRLESRMNATEMGMSAARNLLGAAEPFAPLPYLWTDQYDVKVQGWGHIAPHAESHLVSGSVTGGAFVLAFERQGRVEGVLGWNAPRELRKARALVGQPLMAES